MRKLLLALSCVLSLAIVVPSFAADPDPAGPTNVDPPPPALAPEKPAKKSSSGASSLSCIETSEKGAAELDESCSIAVGVIDVRDFDFVPKVQLGNESLLQSKEGSNPNQIRLVPLKKGTTSILVEDKNGGHRQRITYNITTNDLSSKVEAIRQLLADVEGISIRSLDDKIIIDGEIIVPRDLDRIVAVQQVYADSVVNLVTLSRISREAIARRMQKEINDATGGANVMVSVKNDTFFLTGKVDSQLDKDRFELIAKTYLPDSVGSVALKEGALIAGIKGKAALQNLIETEEPPPEPSKKMVRVTYHFVEISKSYLKSSYFKWAPLLSQGAGIQVGASTTGGVAATGAGSFVGTISDLFPKLQSGANGGFSRVLYSTVTLGMDGEKMEVIRHDSIPYISSLVNGVPVTANATAGMSIAVTPKIAQDGDKITLTTNFDFSAFTGAGAGGAPAKTDTVLKNTLVVKNGESAVLGGLVSNNIAKDIGKDPTASSGASTGDPLFNLLRSKSFQNDKTQFVVFITPKVIEDAAEGTADIKSKIINTTKRRQRTIQ